MGQKVNKTEKKGFSIVNKTATTAEITIYEEIGGWWGLTAKDFSDKLNEIPATVNEITVRINSGGGDVFDGVSIYNRLKQHKAKVIVYIDGLAASIASIIALAGDEIIMGEGALMMIHKPWTWTAGDSKAHEDQINKLDDVEDQLIGIYHRKTKIDKQEIANMLAAETWLNADQALAKGFVTSKMAEDDTVDMAASLEKASWIKNKPNFSNFSNNKKPNAELVKKASEIKHKVGDFLARSHA